MTSPPHTWQPLVHGRCRRGMTQVCMRAHGRETCDSILHAWIHHMQLAWCRCTNHQRKPLLDLLDRMPHAYLPMQLIASCMHAGLSASHTLSSIHPSMQVWRICCGAVHAWIAPGLNVLHCGTRGPSTQTSCMHSTWASRYACMHACVIVVQGACMHACI